MTETKKNNSLKTITTIGISLLFAVFFMWIASRELNISKIEEIFLKADYLWIFVALIFATMAYWFRAIRWNIFLEPIGYKISNANAFWTISFGYLMNLTIPRSGEVARSTALYRVEKVPIDKSFGTIILERIVDLFFMFFFLFLTAIFKYTALISFYNYLNGQKENSSKEYNISWKLFILGCVVISFILFFFLIKRVSLYNKLISFFKGLSEGLNSVFKIKHKTKFFLYSLGIWACYYFAAYLICFALPETSSFGFTDGFFLITVGTLGMIVPVSGGIGAYHLALKLGVMGLFLAAGKNPEDGATVGLSYAFISHAVQLFTILFMGFISIYMLAKSRKI